VPFAESSDGAKIFYEAQGSGPPLLLCTASFCTHRHWRDAAAALSRNLRVVVWDYRGHGRSEAPPETQRYSLEQVVRDLESVHQAAAGDEPALVGGLSIGGLVALIYALRAPERVRALLLFNTGPGFKRPEAAAAWGESLERAAGKLERVGLAEYLKGRNAQAQILGLDPESDGAREAEQGFLSSSVAGLTRFARHVAGPVPNLVDELHRVAQPTLVLVGEEDAAFQRASEVMAAKLPDAERVVLPGAGHVVNLDRPGAFVAQVEAFVERRGLA
jgi:pimeloyl-ACP methyl ester carboxylesterase